MLFNFINFQGVFKSFIFTKKNETLCKEILIKKSELESLSGVVIHWGETPSNNLSNNSSQFFTSFGSLCSVSNGKFHEQKNLPPCITNSVILSITRFLLIPCLWQNLDQKSFSSPAFASSFTVWVCVSLDVADFIIFYVLRRLQPFINFFL